ncbi:MAG: MBOAT family protein [Acidobacteria bacterium]|nr:MBOAT family protein [Acidobacteriota bacterium]
MPSVDLQRVFGHFLYDPKEPMIFNSGFFLFLFLLFLIVYQFFYNPDKKRAVYITLFSLYFLYKSSGFYFLLLIATSVIDFLAARWMARIPDIRKRRPLLVLSLVSNLGILGYFKYTNLFIQTFNDICHSSFPLLDIFLPVGISFYTFQSLSYTLDVYWDKLEPVDSYLDFCFCVSFFPHLVAGPIIRASFIIPQVYRRISITREAMGRGVFLILCGLFKKAVIADFISVNFVDRVFSSPLQFSGIENLAAVYGYAVQIYCDFSGYSDIAIGLALLVGFTLPVNFDAPYQSATITEFWRRWHISLSSWLKDYLYVPLGGNRCGKVRTYVNLMLTMLLGGLWHGAGWSFVFWGGLHGVALALDKMLGLPQWFARSAWRRVLGVVVTFHFVCLTWIFFRSASFEGAMAMIRQIGWGFHAEILPSLVSGYPAVFGLIGLGLLLHYLPRSAEHLLERGVTRVGLVPQAALMAGMIWLIMQVKSSDIQPFIYFQF